MSDAVLFETKGPIAIITLNGPPDNAITTKTQK